MSEFTHIHTHTDFSTLDGFGSVVEYAEKCSANNMKYLCVTDHGMGAAYPRMLEECLKYPKTVEDCTKNNISLECSKHKIKPVFGCEFYINNYHHLVSNFKNLSDEDKYKARKNYHLILIAKNNVGYENLVKLISEGWINGFYYKPRVSWEQVKQHAEGLICTSACCASIYAQLINADKYKEALDLIKEAKDVFGSDFYLELQMINIEEQDRVNMSYIEISKRLDIPLVLTNDVHYLNKEHSYHQTIELLLNSKGTINKRDGLEFHTDQLWYKTSQEMDEMWKIHYSSEIDENILHQSKENTIKICDSTDVKIDTSPKFPKIENAEEILLNLCLESLKKNGIYNKVIYRQRFLKEYEVICDKDFASYFLVVKKIVDWAKNNGSSVGPGRGCFLPNNIVRTVDKDKYIQEVHVGDLIFGKDGKPHKVLDKFRYNIEEEVYEIQTENNKSIKCTADHKIRVKDEYGKETWVEARNLREGDKLMEIE